MKNDYQPILAFLATALRFHARNIALHAVYGAVVLAFWLAWMFYTILRGRSAWWLLPALLIFILLAAAKEYLLLPARLGLNRSYLEFLRQGKPADAGFVVPRRREIAPVWRRARNLLPGFFPHARACRLALTVLAPENTAPPVLPWRSLAWRVFLRQGTLFLGLAFPFLLLGALFSLTQPRPLMVIVLLMGLLVATLLASMLLAPFGYLLILKDAWEHSRNAANG